MIKRPILSIIIVVLLTIILAVVFVKPKYQEFKKLGSEIKISREELQTKEEYYSEILGISEQFTQYQEELAKIDSNFPSGSSLPSFFNFFQKTCSENGLIFDNIECKSAKGVAVQGFAGKVQEVELSAVVAGSYTSFKNFLKSLEKSSRLIEVESFSFHSPKEKEKEGEEAAAKGIYSFNLEMKTYSY